MANQNYRGRLTDVPPGEDTTHPDHPVHGNDRRAQLGLNKGNPTAGKNKTPPPERPYDPRAKDKAWGRDSGNPGSNAWSGASSLHPGEATVDVALAKQADADQTLELLIAKGTSGDREASDKDNLINSQLRRVSAQPYAPVPGHRTNVNSMEKVPLKLGDNAAPLPTRAYANNGF